jgi:hypothetical protein
MVSPIITLKSFFSALIRFQTPKLFQKGFFCPGCGSASWSPVRAKWMVFAWPGFGAVSKVPVELCLPPAMQKRYL